VPGGPIPTLANFGAQSVNVENANIPGFEVSVVGKGDLGKLDLNILAGYTYINPTSINPDSAYIETFSNPELKTLKYRNKHIAKIDFQLDYKKIAFGLSTRYNSFMENVDLVFTVPLIGSMEILPGYGDYRNARQTGDIVFDARFAINISKESKLSILANNLLNREYSNRPGNVLAPRTIIAQYSFNF
jgi:iron complex outermembrane receptor protein